MSVACEFTRGKWNGTNRAVFRLGKESMIVRIMNKFEIFIGSDSKFYFHLKAENGEIIAASQGYTTKQSAECGIDAVKRIAANAGVIDCTLSQGQGLTLGA